MVQKKLFRKPKTCFTTREIRLLVGLDTDWLLRMEKDDILGIHPSIAPSVEGSRKEWSREDVFGVALVWYLYHAGLRLDAIESLSTSTNMGIRGMAEMYRKQRRSMLVKTIYGVTLVVPLKKLFQALESRMYE